MNEFFQTDVPHIYAAGDVIGFPALANTSMEQGRLAVSHMFGIPFEHMPDLFPYGIYTIPEIFIVGQTEETLTANKVPRGHLEQSIQKKQTSAQTHRLSSKLSWTSTKSRLSTIATDEKWSL